jgi:ParB family chromosome partitioning protein
VPKIKYKDISPEMMKLSKPAFLNQGRSSVGLESDVGEYYFLPIEKIKPYKHQARKRFCEEDLSQLAETIKTLGVRQPISIVPSAETGFYEVVSGERRLRAAQMAGLKNIPCLIIKNKEDAEEISLIENIQREDLHPIELGDAYVNILSNKKYGEIKDFAAKIGKHPSSISECCGLARLPYEIKNYLIDRNIRSKPILRKLCKLSDIEEMKVFLKMGDSLKKEKIKSLLKVFCDDGVLKFELPKRTDLSLEQKQQLKEMLLSYIEKL